MVSLLQEEMCEIHNILGDKNSKIIFYDFLAA